MKPNGVDASDFADEVSEWKRIGAAFGIVVRTPYQFAFEGRNHLCVAHLPSFGTAQGMLVRCGSPDVQFMDDAQKAGFGFCHVDLTTWPRGERYIVEMLSDWGFTGPGASPAWMVETHDHHGHDHH